MGILYKSVIKHKYLRDFLLTIYNYDVVRCLKYKTYEKTIEYIHHYGWYNPHLYGIGIYKINNGINISFDYSYEMDPNNLQNITKVISCNLHIL